MGDRHSLVRLHEVPPPQRSGWLNHLGAQLHPRPHPSCLGPPGGAVFENKHKYCPTGPRNEGGARCAAVAWCVAAPTTSGLNHQVAHATGGPTPQHQGRCKGTCPLDSGFKRARRAWAIQVFFAGGGAACGPLCKGADFLWVVGLNHLMAHANRKIESNPSPQPQVPAPEAN